MRYAPQEEDRSGFSKILQQEGANGKGTLIYSPDNCGSFGALVWEGIDSLRLPRHSWGTTAQCEGETPTDPGENPVLLPCSIWPEQGPVSPG